MCPDYVKQSPNFGKYKLISFRVRTLRCIKPRRWSQAECWNWLDSHYMKPAYLRMAQEFYYFRLTRCILIRFEDYQRAIVENTRVEQAMSVCFSLHLPKHSFILSSQQLQLAWWSNRSLGVKRCKVTTNKRLKFLVALMSRCNCLSFSWWYIIVKNGRLKNSYGSGDKPLNLE